MLRILTTLALVGLTVFPIANASPVSSPDKVSDTPVVANNCGECRLKYAMAYFNRAGCSIWLKCNEDGTYCAWGNDCNKDWAYASVRLNGNTIYWYATWHGNKWNRPSSAVSTIEQCGEVSQTLTYPREYTVRIIAYTVCKNMLNSK